MGAGRTYSESIHQDKERMWFGLEPGLALAEDENLTFVNRVHFPGPIKLLKFGVIVRDTMGTDERFFALFRNSSHLGTCVSSTSGAIGAVQSTILDTQYVVDAGSYLTIVSSTGTCSTGSVALFIDYIPLFKGTGSKWAT